MSYEIQTARNYTIKKNYTSELTGNVWIFQGKLEMEFIVLIQINSPLLYQQVMLLYVTNNVSYYI